MGLDASAAQFLCASKNHGVDFSDLLTVGRQNFFPKPDALKRVLRTLGVPKDARIENSEDFYEKALGSKTIAAMDYSEYQGASVIHDLNRPIPPELRNRFGVILDGGSLEHVFNIPQAYKNLMEMVRVGGWFAQLTAANNFLGHGFWQVSPELLFRAFTPENGYELHAVLLKDAYFDQAWYAARDPAVIRKRVILANAAVMYVVVLARKTADVEVFANTPLQSDYVASWGGDGWVPEWSRKSSMLKRAYRRLAPDGLRAATSKARKAFARMNPEFYTKLDLDAFLGGDLGPPPTAPVQAD